MRSIKRMAALAAVVMGGSAAIAAAAAAEDWPKWMGPRGDMISKETVASQWPEDGPKQLWSKQVGFGHASPVAQAGKIYVFSLVDRTNEVPSPLDAATGQEVWVQSYDRAKNPGGKGLNNADWDGTRATPTIDGDAIYTFGSTGDLTRRSLADGKQAWQVNVVKAVKGENLEWGTSSSPLVTDKHVFVQAAIGDGVPVAVAIDKASGAVAWQSEARGMAAADGKFPSGAGYAHMILADVGGTQQLIVFGGRAFYGMDPATGKTLWESPWSTQYDVNAATPIYRDGQVLISSEYSTAKGILYDVTPTGLKQVWVSNDIKAKYQPPIVEDGYIYVNSRGTITCVKWADGKTAWEAKDRDLKLGAGGSFVKAGDKLISMSERGKLSLSRVTPEGIKMLGQVALIEANNVWASPLLYDGKIFAKGGDEIVALDLSGK